MKNKHEYILKNLSCANCANKIQTTLSNDDRFSNVILNFNTTKLIIETDMSSEIQDELIKIIKRIESDVELIPVIQGNPKSESISKRDYARIIPMVRLGIGIILMIITYVLVLPDITNLLLIIIAYSILLYRTTIKAFNKIFKNKVLDENALITISTIGAFFVGNPMEGAMVIILYEIGKILEDRAVNKTRKSIKELMNIRPEYANLKIDEEIKVVSPEEVQVNDLIIIKTGEKVPLDGMVVSGNAQINTEALTGESALRQVKYGDELLSGSINVEGLLEVKVTKQYKDSTVNKILELVESATDRKAKTENFVSKAAKIYTPMVLILAIIVALILPLISDTDFGQSIYRALIFLVISCPCAIAISVPLSYFSGIGRASKVGILVKGSDYLDSLRNTKTIVFDKTGTLTTGNFNISKITSYNSNYSEDEILYLTALGESFSNHPIAKSILQKYNKEIDTSIVEEYEEVSGKGISYKLNDLKLLIGNANLVGDVILDKKENETILYIKANDEIIGSILIKDEVKPNVAEVIEKLERENINVKMFTGDKEEVAKKVADEVGIKEIYFEMLPQDKYQKLKEILTPQSKTIFVGDGINDSPVLALADIGISMGGVGSNSAIEASDVVIMTDEIKKITEAIGISKYTNKIIKQNLIFAFGTKLLFLSLSVFGLTGMWQAVFADVGVTLLTILNSIRVLNKKL